MPLPKHLFSTESLKHFFIASFGVWLVTSSSYGLLSLMIGGLRGAGPYMIYCGLVSLILAQFVVFVLPEQYEETKYQVMGILALSGLILYFSANGIQVLYSSLLYDEHDGDDQGFISARPWFPPAGMSTRAMDYQEQLDSLLAQSEDMTAVIDSLTIASQNTGLTTDSVFLMAIPNSREVPNGGIYQAELVLAAKLDRSYVRRVTVDDEEIPIIDGTAIFEEVSQLGPGNANVRNLNFAAEIELLNENRIITTFDSYKTVTPYIEVASQSVNALYLNCGNQLNMNVPSLGSDYNPKFEVIGGEFRYGGAPGAITVVPSSQKVTIGVYNEGVKIGTKSFPVRRVPAPTIKAFTSAGEIDLSTGVLAQIAYVELRAYADPDFANFMPNDSRYRVSECDLSLISGGTLKGTIRGRNKFNIGHLTRTARPGDILKIEVRQIQRRNFKGDVENVLYYSPRYMAIPLK